MIRLFYNQEGEILYAFTKEAALNLDLPFIDYHDDNIKINEWRIEPGSKELTRVEVQEFSRFR